MGDIEELVDVVLAAAHQKLRARCIVEMDLTAWQAAASVILRNGTAAELDALPRQTVKLGGGDALIFGGDARLVYHGVRKVLPHSCQTRPWNSHGVRRGRLNVTLREW